VHWDAPYEPGKAASARGPTSGARFGRPLARELPHAQTWALQPGVPTLAAGLKACGWTCFALGHAAGVESAPDIDDAGSSSLLNSVRATRQAGGQPAPRLHATARPPFGPPDAWHWMSGACAPRRMAARGPVSVFRPDWAAAHLRSPWHGQPSEGRCVSPSEWCYRELRARLGCLRERSPALLPTSGTLIRRAGEQGSGTAVQQALPRGAGCLAFPPCRQVCGARLSSSHVSPGGVAEAQQCRRRPIDRPSPFAKLPQAAPSQ